MKTIHRILILPLLVLSLFSCTKSETPHAEKIELTDARADVPGEQGNVRVVLSNTNFQPVFAVIQIVPGGDLTGPVLYEQVINVNPVEIEPATEVYFSVPPGTYYAVRVIDTYGQVYYSAAATAANYLTFVNFHGQLSGPATIKYQPPIIPIPETPDDSTSHPAIPGLTTVLKVNVSRFQSTANPITLIELFSEGGTSLQKRMLLGLDTSGSFIYKPEAKFNVAPGTVFRIGCRSSTGMVIYSSVKTKQDYEELVTI